jgi:hypothetical protein
MKARFKLKKATGVISITLSFLGVVVGNGLTQEAIIPNADR